VKTRARVNQFLYKNAIVPDTL